MAKFWVKNREAILTQNVATFISKNRLRFFDQMFTKAQTSTKKHKKAQTSTKTPAKDTEKHIKNNQAQTCTNKHKQAQTSLNKLKQA